MTEIIETSLEEAFAEHFVGQLFDEIPDGPAKQLLADAALTNAAAQIAHVEGYGVAAQKLRALADSLDRRALGTNSRETH